MRPFLALCALTAALALWPALAHSQPVLDANVQTSDGPGGSSTSVAVKTAGANEIVFVASQLSYGSSNTVSAQAISGCGLTWTQISVSSGDAAVAAPSYTIMTVWWAFAVSSISSCTATITWTTGTGWTCNTSFHGCLNASWAVSGANITAPLDPNASLPRIGRTNSNSGPNYTNQGNEGSCSATAGGPISTTTAHTKVFLLTTSQFGQGPGCGTETALFNFGGSGLNILYGQWVDFTTPQTSKNLAQTQGANLLSMFAATADSASTSRSHVAVIQ